MSHLGYFGKGGSKTRELICRAFHCPDVYPSVSRAVDEEDIQPAIAIIQSTEWTGLEFSVVLLLAGTAWSGKIFGRIV